MTNKTDIVVKNETFFMARWEDEGFINSRLFELGFDMDNTTWVYSWTVPSWVPENNRADVEKKLVDSDYYGYLVNVRQVVPR